MATKLTKNEALNFILTIAEAAERWKLGESTLRSAIFRGKFQEGVDVRKSGKTWLITYDVMEKNYGKPKQTSINSKNT